MLAKENKTWQIGRKIDKKLRGKIEKFNEADNLLDFSRLVLYNKNEKFMTNEYGKNTMDLDEVLCAKAAQGDRAAEETLVHRHTRLVRVCARPFFLAGGDSEDLIQEGMIGLITAIREYDPSRGARFRTFAATCVRRRLISVVRAAAGGKHIPLNESVSLDPSLVLAHQDLQGFGTAYPQGNPEDAVIHAEDLSALEEAIRTGLTQLESRVLTLYLEGLSYREIAEEVHRSTKAVDNAVQRVRRKVAQYLSHGEPSES